MTSRSHGLAKIFRAFVQAFPALVLAVMTLVIISPPSAFAATGSVRIPGGGVVQISADRLDRDFDLRTVVLEGNVKMIYDQQYISCDRAVISEKNLTIEAQGNLVISSLQAYVEGDRATLNYRDNTGVIQNGFVKSGQVIFEGTVVRKTGTNSYEAENSFFTACTTCPTAWTFEGSRMNAEMGGYAHIKNPVLRVANFPVLWLPYLIVPLKSERQSGLLVPTMDYRNEDGIVLGFPVFWAISESQDLTLTLKTYSLRGLKGLASYRYMLSEASSGQADFGIINDSAFNKTSGSGGKLTRWFLSYDHKYELPYDFSQKLKLNFVSDLDYPKDFFDEMRGRGDPALENRLSLTKNTERTHSSLDVGYYVNLLKSNSSTSNEDAVHRWPELTYALTERPLFGTSLLFNFKTSYVNFARDEFAWDDVSTTSDPIDIDPGRTGAGGGRFEPGQDVIRTGQRLDFLPELSYPLKIGRFIDILPTLQFRYTQYAFNLTPGSGQQFDTTPSRNYLRGRVAARMRFFRIYGNQAGNDVRPEPKPVTSNWVDAESRVDETSDLSKVKPPERPSLYRHEIEPEIIAARTPYIVQPVDHPFFNVAGQVPVFLDAEPISSSNLETRSIQFDYFDRLTNYNTLTFALTNRLVRKRWLSGAPEYRQIASFRLAQSYDFAEAAREQLPRLPWSDVSATLDLNIDSVDTSSVVRYYPYHRVAKSSNYVRYKTNSGQNYFEVGYSQNFRITRENAINAPNAQRVSEDAENLSFATGFTTRYLQMVGGVNFQPDGWPMTFKSFATDINIRPPGNCWGVQVHIEQPLGGSTGVRFNFDYNFGGESS